MLDGLLKKKTNNTFIQIFRYGFVAGAAFTVDFGTYNILVYLMDMNYLIANVPAFCLGLTTNYLLSVFWVFNERRVENRALEFTINALIATVGLGLNTLFIWIFTHYGGLEPWLSKLISTATVFWWNFFAKKKILFTAKAST